jgi:hypothetical protein
VRCSNHDHHDTGGENHRFSDPGVHDQSARARDGRAVPGGGRRPTCSASGRDEAVAPPALLPGQRKPEPHNLTCALSRTWERRREFITRQISHMCQVEQVCAAESRLHSRVVNSFLLYLNTNWRYSPYSRHPKNCPYCINPSHWNRPCTHRSASPGRTRRIEKNGSVFRAQRFW